MSERTVVVAGASGGVGRAVAGRFGASGAAVALIARGDAGLRSAADAAAARVEDELGPIDVSVNDAFTSVFAPFTDIAEECRRVTEVTYLGYVYGTQTGQVGRGP